MTIQAILDSLSNQRFSTYQNQVMGGTTPEQCLGLYLWNKQLASTFLPVIQIIEVSLRNAIYQSWIKHAKEEIERTFSPYLWPEKKQAIDTLWFKTAMTAQNNKIANRNIITAENQLRKEGKPLTPENYIAKLTLGFWVSLVDKKFDIQQQSYLSLWPHLRGRVFPYARTQKETPLSINSIGNELKEINNLRNRLSHHEPLWRTEKAYTIEDIINKVVKVYDRCLMIIYWINPSNLKLLTIIENNSKMSGLCSVHALWRNKQLPAGLQDLPITTNWGIMNHINTEHIGEVIEIDDKNHWMMIKSEKDKGIFYASERDISNGAAQYKKGDRVRFIPEANQIAKYPNAKSVFHIIQRV
ncbi:Abi family protein [Photorhabdus temperata]|uniref:Abi-like protein n=1 Tax=Photorhabdus temperata subsp. temperata Meg1 TaxID=1393735 RepID=A0A081RTG0_PHOTE|nr:Abi family protein [Photorhabdus temperata]KER01963.1 Abi-like protein [Photorhabdus temperata subsp. temperata Meg1]MCT8348724.1 Abi family protein [Photorhabdus temperata]